jgi:hypothetical protein
MCRQPQLLVVVALVSLIGVGNALAADYTAISITRYQGAGAEACDSSSYNTTTYHLGDCSSNASANVGVSYSCSQGGSCVQTLLYSGMGCSGNVIVSTAYVCDVCQGFGGTYMKYTGCSSGSPMMNICSDSACASCSSSVPYPLGCNGMNNAQVVACVHVNVRTYGGGNCSGSPTMRAAVGAGLCMGGLYYQCT